MSNLNSISLRISDSYKQIRLKKKSPDTISAKDPHEILDKISGSLLTTRQNIQKFRDLDIRLERLTSKRIVKPWRGAIRDALRKMESYKQDLVNAQKRWRYVTPNPKRMVSIYPLTTTKSLFSESLSDLFRAVKNKFGVNVTLPYKKYNNTTNTTNTINTTNTTRQSGDVPIKVFNASLSPSKAFDIVEKAWKSYLDSRRVAPLRLRSPRRIGDEVSLSRINMTEFKGIRNRAMYMSKKNIPYIKKVLTMYQSYIGHMENAYREASKQKPTKINPPEGPVFASTVVAFFHYLDIPIKSSGYVRVRGTRPTVNTNTKLNTRPYNTNIGSNVDSKIAVRNRNALKRFLDIEKATKKHFMKMYEECDEKYERSLRFLHDLILDYNADVTLYEKYEDVISDMFQKNIIKM